MSTLFALLVFVALIALVVGLIKPSLLKQPSRKRAGLIFGGATILFFVLFAIVTPNSSIVHTSALPSNTATDTAPVATAISSSTDTVAGDPLDDVSSASDDAVAFAALAKTTPASAQAVVLPAGTKAGSASLYPNPALTPGAVLTTDASKVCASGYASSVRNVSVATKKQVYAEYGVSYPQATGAYEVDHFIPLEIGGSNDIKNLWLEPASPPPGFHQKDQFEDYEHAEVCKSLITLQEAQNRMVSDWYGYWLEEIGSTSPSTAVSAQAQTVAPAPVSAPPTQTSTTQPAAPTPSSNAAYYTSSYYSSKYYYPASCTAWKSLSTKYLVSFDTLKQLLTAYPDRTLDPSC